MGFNELRTLLCHNSRHQRQHDDIGGLHGNPLFCLNDRPEGTQPQWPEVKAGKRHCGRLGVRERMPVYQGERGRGVGLTRWSAGRRLVGLLELSTHCRRAGAGEPARTRDPPHIYLLNYNNYNKS